MDATDTILLSTKLKMPAPRKNYVVRRALFKKLSQCADTSVIFVRGGAGTGKTTLLSSFIVETDLKNVGWLSLDVSNANVYSFWLYFTAAVSTFLKDTDDFLAFMRSNLDALHMENLLIMLINRLCGEEDYYIVLDDVHTISDVALIRTFEFFMRSMPSNLHFFMLSREDPPVYLGPLAVSSRLLFIDNRQMSLSPDEGMAFLKQTLHMTGSDEELGNINAYAEGWIGGLQLAAAASTADRHSGELLRAGGGIAAQYLTREIFESLKQTERDFLTRTGVLPYFDAGLCTGAFDGFSAAQFDETIEELTKKNLFIVCLDEQNGVYRYHNILAEYLAQQFSRLPEEEKKALHIKFAAVFEQRKEMEEALGEYFAAGDYTNMMRLASAMGGKTEAWTYLNRVPVDLLVKNADLAAQCFMYNLGNLNVNQCRVLYNKLSEQYGDSDIFQVMRFAEAYVSEGKNIIPEFHALSGEQIEALPFGPVAKAMILVENAAALIEHSRYKEAENCINHAIRTNASANNFADFFAYNQMAQLHEETGDLNESLACYSKSRQAMQSPSMLSGIRSNYYFGITGVYMRRMELAEAAEALEQARKLLESQQIQIDITNMTLAYHLAEMKFLSGNARAGAYEVNGLLSEYPSFSVLTLGRLIHELDCAGMLSPSLADDFIKELASAENYKRQPFMRLLRARILFERGDTAEALTETEEILAFCRANKNKLRLVESGLLKIRMLSRSPATPSGQRETGNLLREAVYYACNDRILMPFYLDRSTLLPLLNSLSFQQTGQSPTAAAENIFIREAIAVCSKEEFVPKEPEILSARELEVLIELAQGITNREIAERLCISQATVKTHVLSIFGKLGVSSRMMAVDSAREKGLLAPR